jgi:uncharacterized protein YbcI
VTTSDPRLDLKSQATAISNAIGSLHREHCGRGADRIRTLIHPELVMTTLEDCFTTVERKMIAEGAFSQVRETRTMFQDWMRPHFVDSVEAATGRKVKALEELDSHFWIGRNSGVWKRPRSTDETRGRGLALIRALMSEVEVHVRNRRTVLRMRKDLSPAPAEL